MMRKLVILVVLLLGACAVNKVGPYYQDANFATPQNARLSFDEAKTVCRAKTIEHKWIGDTQDLNIPQYTACMNGYGYTFNGNVAQ